MTNYDKNGCEDLIYIGTKWGYIGVIKMSGIYLIPMSNSHELTCKYYPVDSQDRVNTGATPTILNSAKMKSLEQQMDKGERYFLD